MICADATAAYPPPLFLPGRSQFQGLTGAGEFARERLHAQPTVFCDLDGPLIDVSERYYLTYRLALSVTSAQFSKPPACRCPLSKEQFWQLKQDRIADPDIALQSGLTETQIPFFLQQVARIVNQPILLQQDQLQPGARWSLSLLARAGIRLVLVTLRRQWEAEKVLRTYGLAHLFTTVQGTGDRLAAYTNNAKLKQELLAGLLNQPEFAQTSKCWMIGDTEADVLAGQAVGIETIALTCGIRSHAYLSQLQPSQIHQSLLAATRELLTTSQTPSP